MKSNVKLDQLKEHIGKGNDAEALKICTELLKDKAGLLSSFKHFPKEEIKEVFNLAVKHKCHKVVIELYEQGKYTPTKDEVSPLIQQVKDLLPQGSEKQDKDHRQKTLRLCRILFQSRTKFNSSDSNLDGESIYDLFTLSIKHKHRDITRLITQSGKGLNNYLKDKEKISWDCVFDAVEFGSVDALGYLRFIPSKDSKYITKYMVKDIVKTKNSEGYDAFHWAVFHKQLSVVKHFLANEYGLYDAFYQHLYDPKEIYHINKLHTVTLNWRDHSFKQDVTPLFTATSNNDKDMVSYLTEKTEKKAQLIPDVITINDFPTNLIPEVLKPLIDVKGTETFATVVLPLDCFLKRKPGKEHTKLKMGSFKIKLKNEDKTISFPWSFLHEAIADGDQISFDAIHKNNKDDIANTEGLLLNLVLIAALSPNLDIFKTLCDQTKDLDYKMIENHIVTHGNNQGEDKLQYLQYLINSKKIPFNPTQHQDIKIEQSNEDGLPLPLEPLKYVRNTIEIEEITNITSKKEEEERQNGDSGYISSPKIGGENNPPPPFNPEIYHIEQGNTPLTEEEKEQQNQKEETTTNKPTLGQLLEEFCKTNNITVDKYKQIASSKPYPLNPEYLRDEDNVSSEIKSIVNLIEEKLQYPFENGKENRAFKAIMEELLKTIISGIDNKLELAGSVSKETTPKEMVALVEYIKLYPKTAKLVLEEIKSQYSSNDKQRN